MVELKHKKTGTVLDAPKNKVFLADYNRTEIPNWCPGCVYPETLIHTNYILKTIEKIKVNDLVLSNDGKYHRVLETMKHNHKGKMYQIKSKCFGEVILTEEHPVLISKRQHSKRHNQNFPLLWERADKIEKGDYLLYPIPKRSVDIKKILIPKRLSQDRRSYDLPSEIKVSKDFMRLSGYFIAEGWIHKRTIQKNKIDSIACFAFNIKEQDYVKDISKIVKKIFGLSITTKIKKEKNLIEVYINSSRIARLFRDLFGSGAVNKKIPEQWLLLPFKKQKELLNGLWRGDGWIDKKRLRAHYKTISNILAEQIKLIMLRMGIVSSVLKEEAKGIHKSSWAVWVIGKRDFPLLQDILGLKRSKISSGKVPSSVITADYVMLPVSKIETLNYNGLVYNLEVEDVQNYVSENAILHNCGDFGILAGVKKALVELNLEPHQVMLVSGVGCYAKLPYWIRTNGFVGLHGRELAVGQGAKLVNPKLNVLVFSGDGAGYGEGGNHFIHACRRGINLTYIIHNNGVFGLTTGQYSPTSEQGWISKSSPTGSREKPINPLALAISAGATFVARAYAMNLKELVEIIKQAIQHKGFAVVDVLQPCVSFAHKPEFYNERIYYLGKNYDASNKLKALEKALEINERIALGVFYKE